MTEHSRLRSLPPAPRREPAGAPAGYAEDAKALLQERFREKLHLDDVARALYVSTFHLCRLFKEETGLPIHHYLTRLRLREAVEPVWEARPIWAAWRSIWASRATATSPPRSAGSSGSLRGEVRKAGKARLLSH